METSPLLPGDKVVTRAPWKGFLPAYVDVCHANGTYDLSIPDVGAARNTIMAGGKMINVERKDIWTLHDVKISGIPK